MATSSQHWDLRKMGDFSNEGLCRRILERHRDKISTKKPHLAVANLTRIVEAVLKLSNSNGFHATSLRDLSRESGLSMGGLYSYFDSKDALLLMILGEVETTVIQVLGMAPDELSEGSVAHLTWLIETHVSLTDLMQPWFVFAYMEAKSFPADARKAAMESEAATERVFARALREGVSRGAFRDIDPDFTAALIKPLLQDWYVKRGKWRKRGINARTYAQGVVRFVLSAIGGDVDAEDRRGTPERS